jgi:aspartate/tyrosine/aromatic aminotransferase
MPFFHDLPLLPDDPILSLPFAYAADPNPQKVNLGIGAYKTAAGLPLVLSSVRKAESQILQKQLNKEYLPIEGDPEFLRCAAQLLLGECSPLLQSHTFFNAQTIGGSGALRIAGEFLSKQISKTIFISQPSWPNHKLIFERSGLNVGSYPYFDAKTHSIDFDGLCKAIKNMPASSIILMHGCCHNPTGLDPSFEQWKELSNLIKQQRVIPIFDIAYQGFGRGVEEDAEAIRYFAHEGHEMIVCYSFAKNFGIYGERVGSIFIFTEKEESIKSIASQLKVMIRGSYSTPPLQGERIVTTILKSQELTQEWEAELKNMRDRINEMRKALVGIFLICTTNMVFFHSAA